MGMLIVCVVLGTAMVACAAGMITAVAENRALRRQLGPIAEAKGEASRIRRRARAVLADAELEATRLTMRAHATVIAAEDEATRIIADAHRQLDALREARDDGERDEVTGVHRRPRALYLS